MGLQEMYRVNKSLQGFEVASKKYTVKLAESREEVEKALRLRFDVFNIELGEGLQESYINQMDEDEFDMQCHHLLVIHNDSEEVVGTYRMQDNDMAEAGNGFYTMAEFDVSQFPEEIIHDAVELGRACIHRDHRNGRVLFLLWRGLAKYLVMSKKNHLFGCCSLTSQDPNIGLQTFIHLQKNGYMHPDFILPVSEEYECLSLADEDYAEEDISIPQLFRLYLEQKCKVCSPPALDRTFKTIDFLILLNINDLSEHQRTLFFH